MRLTSEQRCRSSHLHDFTTHMLQRLTPNLLHRALLTSQAFTKQQGFQVLQARAPLSEPPSTSES